MAREHLEEPQIGRIELVEAELETTITPTTVGP